MSSLRYSDSNYVLNLLYFFGELASQSEVVLNYLIDKRDVSRHSIQPIDLYYLGDGVPNKTEAATQDQSDADELNSHNPKLRLRKANN